MADIKLLIGLVASLLITSLLISFITGGDAATLGDTAKFKSTDINFAGNENASYGEKITGGYWEITENGLESKSDILLNYVYFVKKWAETGIYDNTYTIHNPDNRVYNVVIRQTMLFSDTVLLRVDRGGLYLEDGGISIFGAHLYQEFIPYNTATLGTDYKIRTISDEDAKTVTVFINDEQVAYYRNVPQDSIFSIGNNYYSGIAVDKSGFVIKSLKTTGESLEETTYDAWNFLSSLGGVLGWYTSSGNDIVDLFVNLIIKVQQFGIVAIIITIARGN